MDENTHKKGKKLYDNDTYYYCYDDLFFISLYNTIKQQRIKYKYKYHKFIFLNHYNLIIDTVFGILSNIDYLIANKKNVKLFVIDKDIPISNYPHWYNGRTFSQLHKRPISINLLEFIRENAFIVKNLIECSKLIRKKEIETDISKKIENEEIESLEEDISEEENREIEYRKKRTKTELEKDIEIMESIISKEKQSSTNEKKRNRSDKKTTTNRLLKIRIRQLNEHEEYLKELDKYYEQFRMYREYKPSTKYNNIYMFKRYINKLELNIFHIQNRLTLKEIDLVYDYVLRCLKFDIITNTDDIINDDSKTIHVVTNSYISKLLEKDNKIKELDFRSITYKEKYSLFNRVYTTAYNIIEYTPKDISLMDILKNSKTLSPLRDEENEKYHAEVFFKKIIDIDRDRLINLFFEYKQEDLYNVNINRSVISDFNEHNLYIGIKDVDFYDYEMNLSKLLNRYKFKNSILI